MRFVPPLFAALLLTAACGAGEQAEPAAEEIEPAGPTLADFAGTWEVQSMIEGAEDPVPATMRGSADGSVWTMDLEGRPGLTMTVRMSGDSLVGETGEFESILRDGVTVQVRTASVMQGGELVGKLVATYKTPDGDEVVNGTMRATRAN